MEKTNNNYTTILSFTSTENDGIEMTNAQFEKGKKYICEIIKQKAIKEGIEVLDYYSNLEETPCMDFVKEYNRAVKPKYRIEINKANITKFNEWWCWFEGSGIDKIRNDIKKIDFDKIENEVIDYIKWEIIDNKKGWLESYRKSYNEHYMPLRELISCLLNSNEINEYVGEVLGIDNLTDTELDIIIENAIEKNEQLIEEIYNNEIENRIAEYWNKVKEIFSKFTDEELIKMYETEDTDDLDNIIYWSNSISENQTKLILKGYEDLRIEYTEYVYTIPDIIWNEIKKRNIEL